MNKFERNGIVIFEEDEKLVHAWVDGGAHEWFIYPQERSLPPESMAGIMTNLWQNGKYYRCSSCGKLMAKENVASWPLFAGVACDVCTVNYQKHLDEQRRMGYVCRFCGKPFDVCCC